MWMIPNLKNIFCVLSHTSVLSCVNKVPHNTEYIKDTATENCPQVNHFILGCGHYQLLWIEVDIDNS